MQRADDVGERGLDGQRNLGGPVGRAQNLQAGGGVRRHWFDQRAGQRGDVDGPTSLAARLTGA